MSSQVLYRKWRPQRFSEIVGQQWIIRTLTNAVAMNRIAHAYLFCGPRGTGKTSLARILAKAINCLETIEGEPCTTCAICQAITEGKALDLIEIDAASNRGIDEIRSLREKAGFVPNETRYKVYIIDEAHMLTDPAFNALLKTLEEPPGHVLFILATTEAHKLPATIISRCQRFDLRRLSEDEIQHRLSEVSQGEGMEVEHGSLKLIAEASSGSLRDAENFLEQLSTYHGSSISLVHAQELLGKPPAKELAMLVSHIVNGNAPEGIAAIKGLVTSGFEVRQLHRAILAHLRDLLLLKATPSDSNNQEDTNQLLTSQANSVTVENLITAIQAFGAIDLRQDPFSPLPLELAIVALSSNNVSRQDQASKEMEQADHTPVERPQPTYTPIGDTGDTKPPEIATSDPRPVEQEATIVQNPALPQEDTNENPAISTEPPAPQEKLEPNGLLDKLVVGWKEMLESAPPHIKKTNSLAFLRGSCRPSAIEDEKIVLAFKWPIHKENIEKPENKHTVEELVNTFLGTNYQIRCVLSYDNPQEQHQQVKGHLVRAAMEMGAVPSLDESSGESKGGQNEQKSP